MLYRVLESAFSTIWVICPNVSSVLNTISLPCNMSCCTWFLTLVSGIFAYCVSSTSACSAARFLCAGSVSRSSSSLARSRDSIFSTAVLAPSSPFVSSTPSATESVATSVILDTFDFFAPFSGGGRISNISMGKSSGIPE